MKRRSVLAGIAAAFTAGCTKIGETDTFRGLVDGAETLHRGAHRLVGGRRPMAREFTVADLSPDFRGNGTIAIPTDAYQAQLAAGFPAWRLAVTGLVERPLSLSLDHLQALPQRTQITRHDCVEGWSAIGQWTGPRLATILQMARLREDARYIVFRCADTLAGVPYYESCDLDDALHPQTLIAHRLNGEPLPEKNGAPLRLRIERQLGYKHAKYLTGIEAVASLDGIGQGGGGYWEDRAGYQWYGGI
ncbi:MAG: molybdopterin-binding protein [Sphingomonadales bacterium 32-68-7]|nr:MAG: molybdopterin-binding protein [Sphingomonadales bacterium 12-68-11]OYX09288.1 MAG: molybdopterin-binding protein [Sphingomonadales bacterium 32-68-7]